MGEQVTKSAYEKMGKKLKELKGKRAKISKAIGEARDHGDIRENSAYHAAKEEQGLNEMRIKDLETRLANAVVVSEKDLPKSDTVRLNSTVRVKALDTEDEFEYTIVPEIDADVLEGKISTDSPIGGAVFNHKKGQVVKAELPRGEVKFKILDVKLIIFGFLLLALLANGCGQTASTDSGSGGVPGIESIGVYAEASDTTPVFVPSIRVTAASPVPYGIGASTWGANNTMYDVFYALREYLHPNDDGVVDRANLYRLLYDVENLFNAMTSEVVALASAEVIVPPFNFGNNATYETAVNDTASERAAAITTSGMTTRGIVTWIWRDTSLPNKMEFGVLEATMDTATKDLSVDFVFCVDYDTSDTVSDYNNRTRISGNSGTHAFEFVQTIAGSIGVNSQIVGKGVSQGAGENFLLKIKNGNNDGFSSAAYLVISAEATENTLLAMDASSEAITDPASLPATVASYKNYVETTAFYAFSDILSDTAALNAGNAKAGTIYLNY